MKTLRYSSLLFAAGMILFFATSNPPRVVAQTQPPVAVADMEVAPGAPRVGTTAIVAGDYHTCAVTTSNGAKCWGYNASGQLGDGTTTNRLTPVDVSGLSNGMSMIAPGMDHACALTTGGGVKCWGDNFYGQLGDGTRTAQLTPVDVSGLSNGVRAIAAGMDHTCALMTSGGVKCWGYNASGQLGDGTMYMRLTPVDVSGLSSGVRAIAVGWDHTCALMTSGGVKCWGGNLYGYLGDGTTTNRLTPVDVSGLNSGASTIAAGFAHSCALMTSGGVKCWGYNSFGQVGDGTTTNRFTPVDVSGLTSGVRAIAVGWNHTCALTTSGGSKCWGNNSFGQIGDGTTTNRRTPVDVSGLTTGVTAISAGGHSCAITTSSVKCWGRNSYGQLGDGTTTDHYAPVNVLGLEGGTFIDLTVSVYKAVAAGERAPYNNILGYFADALYEMSNGTEKIRTLTIYQNGVNSENANVVWSSSTWPRASPAGYGHSGQHVYFADTFPFNIPYNALAASNQRGAGYALAHEWGHYYYGLYDEYKGDKAEYNEQLTMPHTNDVAVSNSIMNSQWNAVGGAYLWLNLSVSKYTQNGKAKTAQDRVYGASGWETVARPVSQDPRDGNRSALSVRHYYPELTTVAPSAGQFPTIELTTTPTTTTRSDLNISWSDATKLPARTATSSSYVATVESVLGSDITYPQPAILVATVANNHLIARAGINVTTTTPSGSVATLILKDDGVYPDNLADDGRYSGYLLYSQDGDYAVTVTFDNNAGTAVYTELGEMHAVGPDGETYSPTYPPVGENFSGTATTHTLVTGMKADDHGNTAQTATTLPTNNVDVDGQIDYAGDVDLFKITPSQSGQLIVRVSNLALGMLPRIRFLGADGTTVLNTFNFQPNANQYFFASVNVNAGGVFYVEIYHQNSSATGGMYSISAGSPLAREASSGTTIYLPFIKK